MFKEVVCPAFAKFDKDGSGSIDNQEVLDLLQGPDIQNLCSMEAIEAAVKEIDANGDGEIDYEEFTFMMKKATKINEKHKEPKNSRVKSLKRG